ncbi:MAG TPA: CAP domain-containing protein [Kofleriaceae bacterium]|nr:CAP domain-containing protein [Kofleriaceae bacterium]
MLAVLAAACVDHFPPVVHRSEELAPAADPLAPAIAYTASQPAARWNEPVDPATAATPSHETDAVFSGLIELVGSDNSELERDPQLDAVATELSVMASKGAALDGGLVEFALGQHGVADMATLVLAAKATEPAAIVDELRPELGDALRPANARVGIGGMSPMVLVVTHASLATLAPLPRSLPVHGEVAIDVKLEAHAPKITVTHDDGSLEHLTDTRFRCGGHKGTQWVAVDSGELTGDPPVSTIVLVFSIDCGAPPRTTYYVEPRANTIDARDPEQRLVEIIDRERAAAQLPPLAIDLRAADAARAAANQMRATGRVAHAQAGSTMSSRLLDAGVIPPVAREATLHAPDLATAAELLMNEPGYRDAILARDINHAGIGIARDDHGELYVAVELVQIVPPVDVVRLRRDVAARIRLDKLQTLDHVAEIIARGHAHGWRDADVFERATAEVPEGFAHVQRYMTLLLDDSIDRVDFGTPDRRADTAGIAVVQAPRDGAYAGRTYVVIVYARRAFNNYADDKRNVKSGY